MVEWKTHFDKTLSFIEEYQSFIDCHLVDFITENLWQKCLSESLRLQLECTEFENMSENSENLDFKILRKASPELDRFLKKVESLALKHSPMVTNLNDVCSVLPEAKCANFMGKNKNMTFMSNKKQHETKALAKLVTHLAKENSIDLVIDAGAGKGYLSTNISQKYRMPVLAIDSSEINVKGAINRQELLRKKKLENNALVRYSIQHIDEKTDYNEIIRREFSDKEMRENYMLTGLHTCGQLAHSMIKQFLSTTCIKCICLVPCCYHLTKESLTGDCNFTINARMIAQQSVERSESKGVHRAHPPSLFYRALLQTVLKALDIPGATVGRGAPPARDFPSYALWALKKIGVEPEKLPSVQLLSHLYESHATSRWKFNVFQSLRIHLGSVVEAAIVLDRVTYLQIPSKLMHFHDDAGETFFEDGETVSSSYCSGGQFWSHKKNFDDLYVFYMLGG